MRLPPIQCSELIHFALDLCPDRFFIGDMRARALDLWAEYRRSPFYRETIHERTHFLQLAKFLKERK